MQKESVTIITFIESSIDSDSVIIRERFELAATFQTIRQVLRYVGNNYHIIVI